MLCHQRRRSLKWQPEKNVITQSRINVWPNILNVWLLFSGCLCPCLTVMLTRQLSLRTTFFSPVPEVCSMTSHWLLSMSMATALSEQTSLTRPTLPFPLFNTQHAAYLMIHCRLVLGSRPLTRLVTDLQSIWLTGMASHPPIPIMDLADHLERLKANDNLKFSQEYEVRALLMIKTVESHRQLNQHYIGACTSATSKYCHDFVWRAIPQSCTPWCFPWKP